MAGRAAALVLGVPAQAMAGVGIAESSSLIVRMS
jgi:hypothetical protein